MTNVLTPVKTFKVGSDILATRFSQDGSQFSVGLSDGSIIVRASKGDYALINTLKIDARDAVTCLRYRPNQGTTSTLMAAYATGIVRVWHTTSGSCLAVIDSKTENLTAIDYSADGSKFAIGGGDFIVRIFDSETNEEIVPLGPGSIRSTKVGQLAPEGHTNRVFAVRFHPSIPNQLVTAGWDKTVQVWDIEHHQALRYAYEPFVCGDTLDFDLKRNVLLVGSYSEKTSLQVYDFETMKLVSTITMPTVSRVYACMFLRGFSGYIVCAGSNANELRIVSEERSEVVGVQSSPSAFYSLDTNGDCTLIVAGGADKSVTLYALALKSDDLRASVSPQPPRRAK